jgi:hypothetical protein
MAETVAMKFKNNRDNELGARDRVKRYTDYLKYLEDQRQHWESTWKDITDYILPRRGFYPALGNQANQGEDRHDLILDGTATRAIRVLAAGMQGGLTSPARPWFKLGLEDDDLERSPNVKSWLGMTERRMYRVFARSNFYDTIHAVYTELPGFGTACLIEEEDWRDVIRFNALTAGEYCLACNHRNRVDTLYRRAWMTADQMRERWGEDRLGEGPKRALKDNPFEYFEVLNVIAPRDNRDVRKLDSWNMPWESLYCELTNPKDFLSESGYREFPAFAPRWDVAAGDVYGRSPGMDVLSDTKALQEYTSGNIRAIHTRNNPPISAPSSMKGRLKVYPGGINYYAAGQDAATLKPLYEVKPEVQHTMALIQDTRLAIREGLFNDMFLMLLEKPNMTATEVAERHSEKMLMLGPVIERQTHELLDPLIDRTFNIMMRRGLIPPPPREVQGMELRTDYISILAQAQKLVATQSIRGTVSFVAGLAEASQSMAAWDKLNIDEAIDEFSDAIGAPANLILSSADAKKIREARQKAQAEALQRQRAAENIAAAKTLSETDTQTESALTEVRRAMGGGGVA